MVESVRPINRVNLAESVAEQLIELILSGHFKPGDRIPSEKDLVEMFGVGRSSVREAIRALSVFGLLDVRVPEGMFVLQAVNGIFPRQLEMMTKMSPSNQAELIEAREKLEVDVVELAAHKATKEDIDELSEIVNAMRDETLMPHLSQLDKKFHFTLAKIARNAFIEQVMTLMKNSMLTWVDDDEGRERIFGQHKAIFEAVANNDPAAAVQSMQAHLQYVGERYLEALVK